MEYWNESSKSSNHEFEQAGLIGNEHNTAEQTLNLLSINADLANDKKQEPLFTGPFAGLIAGSLVTLGTKEIVEQSIATLPVPAPARFAISFGTGLLMGGFANNAVTGRDPLSYKGFASNAMFTGLGYAGVRMRGF